MKAPTVALFFLLVILAALALQGCTYTSVTTKDGAKMTRLSLVGNQQVGKVNLNAGTLDGYASEQSEAARAIAEGVAAGVAKAVSKP